MVTGVKENRKEALKKLMGDKEFAEWERHQEYLHQKELAKQAVVNATAMVSEKGKYAEVYQKLDVQLGAIWEKALTEARKALGIIEKAEK